MQPHGFVIVITLVLHLSRKFLKVIKGHRHLEGGVEAGPSNYLPGTNFSL